MEIVHAAGSYALAGNYCPEVMDCGNFGSESGRAPDIDRKTYLGDALLTCFRRGPPGALFDVTTIVWLLRRCRSDGA